MAFHAAFSAQRPLSMSSESGSFSSEPDSGAGDGSATAMSVHPDRRVTEKQHSMSSADGHCQCKSGCNTARCACRKDGRSCSPACPCMDSYRARQPCISPFNELSQLFGGVPMRTLLDNTPNSSALQYYLVMSRLDKICMTTASPCFRKYLNGKDRHVDVNELRTMLLRDSTAFEMDPSLAAWRVIRNKYQRESNQEKIQSADEALFIQALSSADVEHEDNTDTDAEVPGNYVWSFCRDRWVDHRITRHCPNCNKCYDDAWHCDDCGKCRTDRMSACDQCGGWSKSAAERGNVGALAADIRETQAATGSGARKRPRAATVAGTNTETPPQQAPKDIATRSCECKNNCSTRACICRKWGKDCNKDCECKTGEHADCHNRLGRYAMLFGQEHAELRLNACLIEATERIHSRKHSVLKVDEIVKRLLKDTSPFTGELLTDLKQLEIWDEEEPELGLNGSVPRDREEDDSDRLQAWYTKWQRFPAGEPYDAWSSDKKIHMQWLFRYALSEERENECREYKFSYCQGRWYTDYEYWHCHACKTCRHKTWWHCGSCKKCATHYKFPCEGCGGLSSTVWEIRTQDKSEGAKRARTEERIDDDDDVEAMEA